MAGGEDGGCLMAVGRVLVYLGLGVASMGYIGLLAVGMLLFFGSGQYTHVLLSLHQ